MHFSKKNNINDFKTTEDYNIHKIFPLLYNSSYSIIDLKDLSKFFEMNFSSQLMVNEYFRIISRTNPFLNNYAVRFMRNRANIGRLKMLYFHTNWCLILNSKENAYQKQKSRRSAAYCNK